MELMELPQIVLTPHISNMADSSLRELGKELFAENLRRFLDDQPLLNLIDRERGH